MLELYEGVHRIISSFQLFNLVLIRFRLENDEKIGKIHVDLLCSGGISENLVSASFLTCVGSDSCVSTTQIGLSKRPVSLF